MAHDGAFKLDWFGNPHYDKRYLEMWRNFPVNYHPGDPTGPRWHTDDHEDVLGRDGTGTLFRRSSDLLMQYLFYPPSLMLVTSDFGLAHRWLKLGDRLIQRVCIVSLFKRPIVEMITMNEVYDVIDQPRIKGFTYLTTKGHSEKGEWSAHVEWTERNEVVVRMHAVSTSITLFPGIARRYQLNAHRLGMAWFAHQVSDISKVSDA